MLYRRKNVWKLGDKNGKWLMSGEGKGLMSGASKKGLMIGNENATVQKKRKLCTSANSLDAEEGVEKKKKRLHMCNSSKFVQGHDQGKMMAALFEKHQDK